MLLLQSDYLHEVLGGVFAGHEDSDVMQLHVAHKPLV